MSISFSFVISLKSPATFSANQNWKQIQASLSRPRFPALNTDHVFYFAFWLAVWVSYTSDRRGSVITCYGFRKLD